MDKITEVDKDLWNRLNEMARQRPYNEGEKILEIQQKLNEIVEWINNQ